MIQLHQSSRAGLLLRRAAGVLVVAILCLGTGELFVRLVAGPPAWFLFSGSFRDRRSSWDLVYGVDENLRRVSCDEPSETARRIAVIGDSFVFGQGVPDCHNFCALLNARQDSIHFENFGNIGSGPDVYRLVARDLVDGSFDGALIVFYGNDLNVPARRSLLGLLADESSVFSLLRKFKRSREVAARMEQVDAELAKEHGRLAVHNNVAAMIQDVDSAYARRCVNPGPDALRRFERKLDRILETLQGKIPRDRIRVTMVPQGSVVSKTLRRFILDLGGEVAPFGEPGEAYRTLQRLADARGLRFIDTFDAFLRDGDRLYWPDDFHWNERGQERMADVLTRSYGLATDADSAPRAD